MKSIPESFQSVSPQIWKCCFINFFEMLDLFSPLLTKITKTLNFKHDHLKTVGFHNCFQTISTILNLNVLTHNFNAF